MGSLPSFSQSPGEDPHPRAELVHVLCSYLASAAPAQMTGADLGGTNFEYALFGKEDIKKVCQNPTLVDESREQVGCPN
eukprot:1154960-Pelagomonas_calceolata.AAC.2